MMMSSEHARAIFPSYLAAVRTLADHIDRWGRV
jgi:hypothetical protein